MCKVIREWCTGSPLMGFKILKQLQLEDKNQLEMHPITKTECKLLQKFYGMN